MFRCTLIVLAACSSLVSAGAWSHEGHDHEEDLTEKQVAQLAAKSMPAVIQSKKLAAAWSKAQQERITVEQAEGKVIWVVAYKNPDGKADSGNALYVFFDELGNYVDANHTGKVPTQ
jgi:Family of unknown function (DUF6488)